MKITVQELLDRGFIKYDPSEFDSKNADAVYQKCFYDKDGNKKYYLNVYEFDFSRFIQGAKTKGYEADVQLYKKDTHEAFNLEFLWDSLDDVESFIDLLFTTGLVENYAEDHFEWRFTKN